MSRTKSVKQNKIYSGETEIRRQHLGYLTIVLKYNFGILLQLLTSLYVFHN